MFLRTAFLSTSLLLAGTWAAVIQQPFNTAGFDLLTESSNALSKLRAAVGDRLIDSSPVGKPCYSQPHPFDPIQCDIVNNSKTNDEWVSDQPGGYFYVFTDLHDLNSEEMATDTQQGNWASCQAEGQTCAIPLNNGGEVPSNATCYQGSVSDHMINVQGIEDIRAAFLYAIETRKPLVIKNTGHDWKGRSGAPGSLALWTHNLRFPKVPTVINRNFQPMNCTSHPVETVFHFGSGETWGGAYQFAENNSLSVVGGTCGTVGIAGWLHGGGHSPLTPVHGMGVDNVRQVEVVTPKGEVKVANECMNTDLYFAVRGGGGGTFGVVTNITYKALEKSTIQELSASLAGLNATAMQEFFEIVTANTILWSQRGWGGYIKTKDAIELVNPASTPQGAAQDMAPLTKFLQDNNREYKLDSCPSWYAYYEKNLMPPNKHVGAFSGAVASRLLPPYVFETQTRNTLADILFSMHSSNLTLWLMLVCPTSFPHTTTSALHPSWQRAVMSVRINAKWDQFYYPTPSENKQYFQTAHQAMDPLRKLAPNMGISLNEADIWEADHELAYWGEVNYKKLLDVKRMVDPENLLSVYNGVGFDAAAERYKCYPRQ